MPPDGAYRASLSLPLDVPGERLDRRALHERDPRWIGSPRPVAAHTSPVYVVAGDADLFSPSDATYMLTLLEGGLTWLDTLSIPADAERQAPTGTSSRGPGRPCTGACTPGGRATAGTRTAHAHRTGGPLMSGATPAVERLGVAIQGAGNVAREHLRAYLGNPHVEVVAICSRTLEGAERKARQVGLDPGRVRLYTDYGDLLADPRVDALSICTPPELHSAETVAGPGPASTC